MNLTIKQNENPAPVAELQPMLTRWIAYIDATPRTVETYTKNIRRFAEYLNEQQIERPTRETVVSYKEYLISEGKKPTTIQGYLNAVKQFFAWTEAEGLYPNIAEHVKGAKLDTEHKKDALTASQTRRLLLSVDRSKIQGARDYAILVLMTTTGLRETSVVSADVADLRQMESGSVLYYKGKGHDEKAIYVKLAPQTEKAILDYLAMRGELAQDAPLFASTSRRNSGERMTTRSISRIAEESLSNANLKTDRLTAHSLRHTAATLNLLNGGTLEETKQLLGHRSINTTMIYAHALERAKNNSESRIAAAIFG